MLLGRALLKSCCLDKTGLVSGRVAACQWWEQRYRLFELGMHKGRNNIIGKSVARNSYGVSQVLPRQRAHVHYGSGGRRTLSFLLRATAHSCFHYSRSRCSNGPSPQQKNETNMFRKKYFSQKLETNFDKSL
jgi:hypothetical protein